MLSQSQDKPGKPEVTGRDVRNTALYGDIHEFFTKVHGPAFGKVSDAADPSPSPDGSQIAFTGFVWEKLEGVPEGRICIAETSTGKVTTVTQGPHDDKLPKWSSDGGRLAFLSDRIETGIFQLYVGKVDELAEAGPASASRENTAEYFHWCPTGTRVLIGMAGRGADKSGSEGSGAILSSEGEEGKGKEDSNKTHWMPDVESGDLDTAWRSLWLYDAIDGGTGIRQVNRPGTNVWEAVWCGDDKVLAIVSDAPGEEAWYTAKLILIDISTGDERVLYQSKRQLGLPVSSPSGGRVAVVQAVCSDRGVVAGDILVIDPQHPESPVTLDIGGTDATQLAWRDEDRLFFMGQRGLHTVGGEVSVKDENAVHELWVTSETCGRRYPQGSPLGAAGFVAVCESWTRYPEIALIAKDSYRTIVSFDHGGGQWLRQQLGPLQEVSWKAPDGLEIQGLLHLPRTATRPLPVVLNVHGGPVWAFRNRWMGIPAWVALFVSRGYAVLSANPRGSGGRGQKFAEMVYGDMGGADTHDYLSGLDALVDRGIVDPARQGVTGGSYGGFMSSWLVTQTGRFAAAVPQAPVNDWFAQHTTSNIPYFDSIFLDRKPYAQDGLYFTRSPARFAGRYPTPVLQTTGAQDRCTPWNQALQYHRALLEHGVESVLVIYPQEGHGVRKFPAYIDFSHRLLSWFNTYMPA